MLFELFSQEEKDLEIIWLLVRYGADPNGKDSKGRTAYDYVTSSDLLRRMKTWHKQSCANGAYGFAGFAWRPSKWSHEVRKGALAAAFEVGRSSENVGTCVPRLFRSCQRSG